VNESAETSHKGWHSRHYLPHWDSSHSIQAITFRLADALPLAVTRDLALDARSAKDRARLDGLLDSGMGECVLKVPEIALIVERALLFFDGQRYRLLAWCVMPNHVHTLIRQEPGFPLGKIVQSWKSFTAKEINSWLGRSGKVWHPDYFDRFIRNDEHLSAALAYIEENPVKARLVKDARGWLWSSARRRQS
jgi:REP element-mobilizing transposase RayT